MIDLSESPPKFCPYCNSKLSERYSCYRLQNSAESCFRYSEEFEYAQFNLKGNYYVVYEQGSFPEIYKSGIPLFTLNKDHDYKDFPKYRDKMIKRVDLDKNFK